MLGTVTIQRSTLEALLKQMNDADADEVTCNLAGWFNEDREGRYIGVQLSERFEKEAPKIQNMTMDEFYHDLKQEQGRQNGQSHSLRSSDKYPWGSNRNTWEIYLSKREAKRDHHKILAGK